MTGTPGRTLVAGVRIAWQRVPPDGARRTVADALVLSLSREADPGASAVGRRCERCGSSDHGRPAVVGAPVQASIAYTADLVVVAVADTTRVLALGIDAEQSTRRRTADLRGVISPGQRTSLRRWTRIEAVLKADGRGLRVKPRRVRVERSLRGVHASIRGEAPNTGTGAAGIRPRLRRVRGPRGVVISLAVATL